MELFMGDVLSAILTFLGGSVVGAVVTQSMQSAKDEKAFKRKKIEELFAELSKYLELARKTIGVITEYHDDKREMAKNEKDALYVLTEQVAESRDKCSVLTTVYFPRIFEEVNALTSYTRKVIILGFDFEKDENPPERDRSTQLLTEFEIIKGKFDRCRSAMSREATLINSPVTYRISLLIDSLWQ
jgi:hypothetical protein